MDEVNKLLENLLTILNSKVRLIDELRLKKNGSLVATLPNGISVTLKNIPQLNETTLAIVANMIRNVLPPPRR